MLFGNREEELSDEAVSLLKFSKHANKKKLDD